MKLKTLTALLLFSSFPCIAHSQIITSKAEAKIEVDTQTGYYELTNITVNGGDESFPRRMADSVIEDLNAFIDNVTDKNFAEIINPDANVQFFGHNRKQSYTKSSAGKQNTVDGDQASEIGILHGMRNTQIVGGNIYTKRAAIRSPKTDLALYKLDVLAGKDYEKYLRNKEIIDAALNQKLKPGTQASSFSRGWNITLGLMSALGIEKSSASDFYGGPKGFMQSVLRLSQWPSSFEDVTLKMNGEDLDITLAQKKPRSDVITQDVIFTERKFLNPLGHHDGGTGYTQSLSQGYQHFTGPKNGSGLTDDILIGTAQSDNLAGGKGRDWLDGNGGDDTLKGAAGHDVLLGRAGDDKIYGGNGDDVLFSGGGKDELYGGRGNDELHSSVKDGTLSAYGEDGDDVFFVKAKKDSAGFHHQFNGGKGSDTVSFRYSNDKIDLTLEGAAQTINHQNIKVDIENIENLTGSSFSDKLTGDARANKLSGRSGSDTLHGQGGDDIVEGGAGADSLSGGDGNDTVSYESSPGGVNVSLQTNNTHAFGADAFGDHFEDAFENLTGSSRADVLEGNNLDNVIKGLSGDDYIIASTGSDTYVGGRGFDTVDYGNHEGGAGLTLDASQSITGYGDGSNPAIGAHKLSEIEHLVGTKWDDVIKFGDGNHVLEGGNGNDKLYGGRGDDKYFVEIGGGHDQIFENGAEGRDTIIIGYEKDLSWNDISFSMAGGAFSVLAKGKIIASIENGPIKGRKFKDLGIEVIEFATSGSIDIDTLEAEYSGNPPTPLNDTITGHDKFSNLLVGLGSDDVLIGGASRDSRTTKGNLFHGGAGNDQMFAGNGNDTYLFDVGSGEDVITDIGGVDHIFFGPGVTLKDLMFEAVGNDIYLGLNTKVNRKSKALKASQVPDRIRIVNAKSKLSNTIELYTIDGETVDIQKLASKKRKPLL